MAKTKKLRSARDRDVHVYNVRGVSKYWMATVRGFVIGAGGSVGGVVDVDQEVAQIEVFKRKADCVKAARIAAKEIKRELVIHGKDGKIKTKLSYGNDPRKSKG